MSLRKNLINLCTFFCCLSSAVFAISVQNQGAENIDIHSKERVDDFADNPKEVDLNDPVLYLLDVKKNNYLFRGNLPEQDGKFCYGGLIQDMRECLAKQGKKLSNDVKLMTISFLNMVTEHEKIAIEKDWFLANQDKGSWLLYSLYGSLIDPVHVPHHVRNSILHVHDVDGVKKLMNKLQELMNSDHSHDLVIYIHCNAGKDRTGEASACYLMEFKGCSYDEAMVLNHQIAGRDLRHVSVHAIRWHAFYLRDLKHFSSIGKIAGK
jgi:hypothetical protein